MDFYRELTDDIVQYIRDYQEGRYDDDTYNFENFNSLDDLMNTFECNEYNNRYLIYEEDIDFSALKDYYAEFQEMAYEGAYFDLDREFFKWVFHNDASELSYYLKIYIFFSCCDRAREILSEEFTEYYSDTEIESQEEDYDEGFDDLEESTKKHKKRLYY